MTTVEKVRHYLLKIEEKKNLNAFIEVYADEALAEAARVDAAIATGKAGRLAGKVIGLKDVLSHDKHGLQGGSKILDGFKAQFSATAVERLLAEDAVIIGRQNCDEFAMGSANENPYYGPVRNSADPSLVGGGSSGGSAVAVQAGLCDMSIGSDTGGSVRQPGAFCGVYGLKPTYGRISRWGLVAYGSSFDCIGPMGSSLDDIALLLEVMAGDDEHDSTVSSQPVERYNLAVDGGTKKLRYGVMREAMESEAIHPDIKVGLQKAIVGLQAAGHTVEVYDFPLMEYILPTYYIITMAEASSNLSRYDGVRYGYRTPNPGNLEQMYKQTRSEGFGPEVKRRILLGTFVLSASYYDAFFTKAQRVRRLISEANATLLDRFDALLLPTTSTPAFPIGKKSEDAVEGFLADIFTVQANLTGQPAISIPAGKTKEGLPFGLQLMGKHFGEYGLIEAAANLEKALQ